VRIDLRVVKNQCAWRLGGIWLWFKTSWAKPISVWGIQHGMTSERSRALIKHFQGEKGIQVPHQDSHCIYRRRVKIGPFSFAAGMYQGKSDET